MIIVLFILGWLFVALGAIGVVLPVLPTTPFMILAAACFAKSSPRFHRWLLANKVFGPLIHNWNSERYIERNTKIRALIVICITFSISIIVVDIVKLRLMWMAIWLTCGVCVASLSTTPKSKRVTK